ncbi:c-type cytochrome [Dyadobacter sp. CY347]|uniref:c-type cytochrome n=1 Tax=Dyadobacter sp. CY347 TaxID=2909336 RepID=UPI001F3B7CD0|nr:cytochrome c [Dyadobacter sp. CY347]MCF2489311.1 cytochrome c [Dyadobacter sp. CY347]
MRENTIRYSIWSVLAMLLLVAAVKRENHFGRTNKTLGDTLDWPKSFGFGKKASAKQIAAWDIDISPDGKGLPAGEGNVSRGREIYALKCAACHGATGTEGPNDRLVAAPDSAGKSSGARRIKSIGNYWPYATTVFDYIRRAMPFNQPGSLTDQEVYSITAFLLNANGLWDDKNTLNAKNLPKVKMPAQDKFVPDDRIDGPEIK